MPLLLALQAFMVFALADKAGVDPGDAIFLSLGVMVLTVIYAVGHARRERK